MFQGTIEWYPELCLLLCWRISSISSSITVTLLWQLHRLWDQWAKTRRYVISYKMYSFLDVFINFHRLIAKISAQDIKIAVIPCLGTLSTLVSYDSISQGQDYCDFICMPGSGLHPYQIIFTDISCSFYNLNAFKDHNSSLCHSHIVRAMGKPFSIMM